MLLYLSLIDNEKPTVISSNDSPQENVDNVVLTCQTSTSGSVSSYEWYKDNGKITSASSNTYTLPDNKRSNSGSYQCKVMTKNFAPLELSDAKTVTFLCKFVS